MKQLLRRDRKKTNMEKFFIAFSTALLLLITINISTTAVFGEEMWIVHATFPGGPAAWFAANVNIWYQTLGTTSVVALNCLADGLMASHFNLLRELFPS